MATLSIGKAWEESVAFVARENALLLPVALLFLALPSLALEQMIPTELTAWLQAGGKGAMPAVSLAFWIGALLSIVVMWFGSLTLFALALRPGISVGEAMRLGIARLPVLIGTALAIIGGIMAVALVGGVIVTAIALVSKPLGGLLVGLLSVMMLAAGLFGSVRMILLNPVVIDGMMGVRGAIFQAWQLTRGHFWRLLVFMVVMMLLLTIVSGAAQAVFGLLGGMVAGAAIGALAGAIAAALVQTVVQLYMLVMIARLYRQQVPA
jgi:hypothetical protein